MFSPFLKILFVRTISRCRVHDLDGCSTTLPVSFTNNVASGDETVLGAGLSAVIASFEKSSREVGEVEFNRLLHAQQETYQFLV
jgi:hypothetical protein